MGSSERVKLAEERRDSSESGGQPWLERGGGQYNVAREMGEGQVYRTRSARLRECGRCRVSEAISSSETSWRSWPACGGKADTAVRAGDVEKRRRW